MSEDIHAASSTSTPRGVHLWIAAIRPATLPAALAPVCVGTALAFADQRFYGPAAAAALFGALFLQIGANLANDYFDWQKGADTGARLGPPRMTHQGWIAPKQMLIATATAFGLAAICGIYLIFRGGIPVLAIGIISIIAGLAYTGGPFPYGYFGWGDLAVFIFFGPIALGGTYYVQALTITPVALLTSTAIGSLITAILVVNNIRDRYTDAAAGKRTLAVRLGRRVSEIEYGLLIGFPFVLVLAFGIVDTSKRGWFAPLLVSPLAFLEYRRLRRLEGSQLNPALGRTARIALLFSALLSGGAVF